MQARQELFSHREWFDLPGTDQLFTDAMRENCQFQYDHCPEYAALLDGAGFLPEQLKTIDDLHKLPPITTVYLKRHNMFSMPYEKQPIKATSSGTRGIKSRIGLDWGAVLAGAKMIWKVARQGKHLSMMPTNYLVMGYEPHKSNKAAVAQTATGYTHLTPIILHREYVLKYGPDGYYVDFEGIISALERYSKSRFPTRFMGFPAYTWFLMEKLKEKGLRFPLPKGSRIYLGGGWKEFYKQQVDKKEFYALAKECFDIDEDQVQESFGAVEHPIWYADCEHHHFHVPVYSRVIIRDPDTLEPVPNGQMGLVNLLTPMVYACPLLSIMTDDLGILHDGETCPCGNKAPWLEIIGRVGMVDIKTCAAGADDLRKGVSL